MVIDTTERATELVKDNKPKSKIKPYRSVAKDMYPKSPTFAMKIIAARGMGKTFLIAFLHSFVNRGIVNMKIFIFFVLHLMNKTSEDH